MDILIILIAVPCFLIIELGMLTKWFEGLWFKYVTSWWHERLADKSERIFNQLCSEGWPEYEATKEAHRRVYHKELFS